MSYVQSLNYSFVPESASAFTQSSFHNAHPQSPTYTTFHQTHPVPKSIQGNPVDQDYFGNPVYPGKGEGNSSPAQTYYHQGSESNRGKRRRLNRRRNGARKIHNSNIPVAPIMGPIFAKDGFVPVVPLNSYHVVNNGSYYQIPIFWTALSYALGLEVHGEIIRGLPCIKRLNQLFCPTAGSTYPSDRIERFIDDNKALTKRMYGEFIMAPGPTSYVGVGTGSVGGNILRRSAREIYEDEVPSFFGHGNHFNHQHGNHTHERTKRQTVNTRNGGPAQKPKSNKVDSCQSTTEIVTPYWAANSAGKVRAIVNTKHFEQAIHQEVCSKKATSRCTGDCGCEQKYKWHRLLAYDPDNDCKGIFMDWFLFPSCCVCRCNP